MGTPQDHDHDHDPDDAEGCLCDVKIDAGEMTGDSDLPPSTGGVAAAGVVGGSEEHIDGCDLDFTKDITPDADLPASTGGVG
jgi:hypothetical protein